MKAALSFISLLLLTLLCGAQSYRFKIFTEQQGLESRYVNTINQDAFGKLVIGTGEGLFTFDGFDFKAFHINNGLADELIQSSYMCANGDLWLGHGSSAITIYSQGKLKAIDLSKYFNGKVADIAEDREGNKWLISQNSGILKISSKNEYTLYTEGIQDYTLASIHVTPSGRMLVGSDMGLIEVKIVNGKIKVVEVPNFPLTNVTDITASQNYIFVATEDSGIYSCYLDNGIYNARPVNYLNQDLSKYYIRSLKVNSNNELWLSTNQHGLIELSGFNGSLFTSLQAYNEAGTNAAESINVSFHDVENNLWIGTIGKGLYCLEENYFAEYQSELFKSGNSSLFAKGDTLYSGFFGKIYISVKHPGMIVDSLDNRNGIPNDFLTSIHIDHKKNTWIATEKSGVYVIKNKSLRAEKVKLSDEFSNVRINDIESENDNVYIATDYGIFFLKNFEVESQATIETGLSANVVKALYKDSKQRIWIATTTEDIPYIENNSIKYLSGVFVDVQASIKCFVEDNQGNIWAGTDGQGIWRCTPDSPKIFNRNNVLNSDYCYSLLCDSKNNIWVGHRASLSKINLNDNAANVYEPDANSNRSFADNSVVTCFGDNLIFGTNQGILRYDDSKDIPNQYEPNLNFTKVIISDSIHAITDRIELPYGDYKFEFHFRGISLKDPNGVQYQYILEDLESEWSKPTVDNFARFNHLSPGKYRFKVKCFNSDGIGGITIKTIEIEIRKPFWQTWWFYLIIFFLVIFIVRVIITRRERILRENQVKLQKALDERTKEVVEQKELLEIKNKDITDSILYAKNIQNAILPPKGSLNKHFSDAYVYYKPRDIVSGDFYFVERFGNKIIVAVADCTGHGVPGAFMSLIGSTLIKDAAKMKDVNTPLELLSVLDHELNIILNKKNENAGIPDGMDISIIDFDIVTKELRFASANRPMFLCVNKELMEVRGNRRSIGDVIERNRTEFTQQSFQLADGDIIYLFSDGITDQFGGPSEKKIKRKGLGDHLKATCHLPIVEQREALKEFINNWKGDHDQLDDMIMLAIQI
ncbi:MAG: two-component regulator propeller domain-containing protein [Flavobacteriales bacterium]|jgi:ligand-binding sensor domain-containing protein/serine phosphatase RsbU (regulator of sigma subunit)